MIKKKDIQSIVTHHKNHLVTNWTGNCFTLKDHI